ncbi:MAG TPA: hypothetical protein PKD45_12780 [Flavobacteriales bacterium]|nr:hypothetical protein [Flavobacteriales bacterium]
MPSPASTLHHAVLVVLIMGLGGCAPSAPDTTPPPEPGMDSALVVGDHLSATNNNGDNTFDKCDPSLMQGYKHASSLARQIADGGVFDLSNDTEALALLDSLFSHHSSRFYMTIVERTMSMSDGYYAEGLGIMAKRFFEERTCILAECCWEKGCSDMDALNGWAKAIASEFLMEEEDPLISFRTYVDTITQRSRRLCDLVGRQRAQEILVAIREQIDMKRYQKERSGQKPADGTYVYDIAFAEWEGRSLGAQCEVIIKGDSIRVVYNGVGSLTVPKGHLLDEGRIMRHKSGQWIIAHDPNDVNAPEVGGCSDGPSVIDFGGRKFWTC